MWESNLLSTIGSSNDGNRPVKTAAEVERQPYGDSSNHGESCAAGK